MATEYRLEHDTLTKVYRRNVDPATSLFEDPPGTNGLSVVQGTLSVDKGHWVYINSDGEAEAALPAAGDNAVRAAMPVWSGGVDRFDTEGGVTVIYGDHIALTSEFVDAAFSPGDPLTLVDDGSGNAILTLATTGDVVVAHVEDGKEDAAGFTNGLLRISTRNAGYTAA